MEQAAGASAADAFQDPTPLLHGGEDFQALATVSDEQLLLRWANVQLSSQRSRQVENFGSDLQDGEALLGRVRVEGKAGKSPQTRREKTRFRCWTLRGLRVSARFRKSRGMLACGRGGPGLGAPCRSDHISPNSAPRPPISQRFRPQPNLADSGQIGFRPNFVDFDLKLVPIWAEFGHFDQFVSRIQTSRPHFGTICASSAWACSSVLSFGRRRFLTPVWELMGMAGSSVRTSFRPRGVGVGRRSSGHRPSLELHAHRHILLGLRTSRPSFPAHRVAPTCLA